VSLPERRRQLAGDRRSRRGAAGQFLHCLNRVRRRFVQPFQKPREESSAITAQLLGKSAGDPVRSIAPRVTVDHPPALELSKELVTSERKSRMSIGPVRAEPPCRAGRGRRRSTRA